MPCNYELKVTVKKIVIRGQVSLLLQVLYLQLVQFRIHTGPGKPGKSWNFIMTFSRIGISPGKRPLVLESSGNLFNSAKKYEVYGRQ